MLLVTFPILILKKKTSIVIIKKNYKEWSIELINEEKMKRARRQAGILSRNGLSYLDLNRYKTLKSSSKKFTNLMNLYVTLNPNWVNELNELERRKPRNVSSPLKLSTHIEGKWRRKNNKELTQEIIKSVVGSGRLIEMAMSIHVANKIAHECEISQGNIIMYYLQQDTRLNIPIDSKNKGWLFKYVQEYLGNEDNPKQDVINYLKRNNISESMLKNIPEDDKKRILTLGKARREAFLIKDSLIYELINDLNHDKEVDAESELILNSRPSYGIYSTEKTDEYGNVRYSRNGEPFMEHRLIIDVPFFGQFCVHLLHEDTISALSQTPYDAVHRFHERKSVILTDNISDYGSSFLKQLQSDGISTFLNMENMELLNKIRELKSKDSRFAHYLALKLGAESDVIDYIYNDDKDEGER